MDAAGLSEASEAELDQVVEVEESSADALASIAGYTGATVGPGALEVPTWALQVARVQSLRRLQEVLEGSTRMTLFPRHLRLDLPEATAISCPWHAWVLTG